MHTAGWHVFGHRSFGVSFHQKAGDDSGRDHEPGGMFGAETYGILFQMLSSLMSVPQMFHVDTVELDPLSGYIGCGQGDARPSTNQQICVAKGHHAILH